MSAKRTLVVSAGDQFGRLTAIRGRDGGETLMPFRCACGVEVMRLVKNVVRGRTTSCGCARTGAGNPNWNGDPKSHPLHSTWLGMLERCSNPNHSRYASYGGRGITVCQRWRENFWNFVEDMGERPDGRSLDRTDNDGPYEPGNVRWATASEQAKNRRSMGGSGVRDVTSGRFAKAASA